LTEQIGFVYVKRLNMYRRAL